MKATLSFLFISGLFLFSACNQSSNQSDTESNGVKTEVVHPAWSKNASIYEINLRQFTREGSINAFAAHLPRLEELGVDILWFMPIHPIGEKNRKGELGSYYSVKDYKGVNPEFGTFEDFTTMVRQAHDLNMKVIIDWVPNHSSWDNPLITEHPEWYALDSTGNMYSPYDWTDVVQFDYTQDGLKDYMIDAFIFWLKEADIDGFRMDVAHQVPIEFWNDVRGPLMEVKPEVFLLAEAENRALHEKAFNMTYAWEFHHMMNEVAQGKKGLSVMLEYFERSETDYNPNDMRMYFTSNHDENSWNGTVWERMGDATEVMAILSYTLPGMPLIYNGQEAGLAHRLEFFVKDSIPWISHPFNELYTNLNRFKKDNPALWNPGFGGTMKLIKNSQPDKVLSFMRTKGENQVLVILNLSPDTIDVELEAFKEPEIFSDFISKETLSFTVPSAKLSAWGYKVLYR
ncbi:MAG: alpha-amylase [Bacteroidetes bacterium]|nr:alpha-amylase [Bacteroidota bacterium]